ncbi:MAG: DUF1858 domain-containing protein [Candidatus Aenigmatarchaeota archaeon]
MKKGITKDMTLGEIVRRYPEVLDIMFKYGLHCPTCPVAAMESLEAGAKGHGIDKRRLNKMLEEMNLKIKKGKEK